MSVVVIAAVLLVTKFLVYGNVEVQCIGAVKVRCNGIAHIYLDGSRIFETQALKSGINCPPALRMEAVAIFKLHIGSTS